MTDKTQLLYMMKTNQGVVKSLIDDITEDESMLHGKDMLNHIRWQTGHLVYCNGYSLSLLQEKTDWESSVGEIFGGGSEITDDATKYPSMEELKAQLYDLHTQLIECLETISVEALNREISEEGKTKPVWQTVTFLCMHEFYHAGQITHMRKILGRDRPFG